MSKYPCKIVSGEHTVCGEVSPGNETDQTQQK